MDFGKDVIPYQITHGKKSSAFTYQGYWEDIGTIESFYQANLALTQGSLGFNLYHDQYPIYAQVNHFPCPRIKETHLHHAIICEGCTIEASLIVHAMIGQRSWIGKNTEISDSIIMGNPLSEEHPEWTFLTKTIGDYCMIKGAIIDEYAMIGNHVHLVNDNQVERYDGDGIFIRDKVIVVASGKKIPDGFKLSVA